MFRVLRYETMKTVEKNNITMFTERGRERERERADRRGVKKKKHL